MPPDQHGRSFRQAHRYSHVTQVMTDALLEGMQRRWERGDADLYPENSETL